MYQESGNSGLCLMQWTDETKQGRPAIILTDLFFKNYVKPIQGRDYAAVAGLIKIARDAGYAPIQTELVQAPNKDNSQMVVWSATVFDPYSKDWWKGHADCTPENVSNSKLAKSFVRIGETRAIGRALRFALGIDLVCFEELADVNEEENWGPSEKPNSNLSLPEKRETKAAPKREERPAASGEGLISDETLSEIKRLVDEEALATWYELRDFAVEKYNKSKRTDLTETQGNEVITWLQSRQAEKSA